MRKFGVRKSMIRYTLLTAIILDMICSFFLEFSWGMRSYVWFIGNVLLIFMFALDQHFSKKFDEAAEAKPGTASRADNVPFTGLLGVFKILGAFEIISNFLILDYVTIEQSKLGWTVGQAKFDRLMSLIWWFVMLLFFYLKRTPMNPPAEKVRESVIAPTPAPANP